MNINSDTALGRAFRTALQSAVGLIVGLFVTIWAVPGVPEVVTDYLRNNLITVLLNVGIPSGITAFIWNVARKDVKSGV